MKNNVFNYGNRTAIITGGSRNIGLAIAEKFLQLGMQVAIIGSTPENLRIAENKLKEIGYDKFSSWCCDISKVDEISAVVSKINDHHGSIDLLVNCAGLLELTSIEEMREDEWDSVMDTNLKGTFFMVQKCLPFLKKGQHPRIINISSNAGRMGGYANGMAYTASKGGMISLTYGLARKLAPYKITVNCIAPGTIDSDMVRMRDPETQKKLLERFPVGRLGTSAEVAAAACYFASQESGFTTGATLDLNGGMFMG